MPESKCSKCGAVVDAALHAKALTLDPRALDLEIGKADLNVRRSQAGVAVDGGWKAVELALKSLTHARDHRTHKIA